MLHSLYAMTILVNFNSLYAFEILLGCLQVCSDVLQVSYAAFPAEV